MIRRPPRSTLFPYTTLFRSVRRRGIVGGSSPIVRDVMAYEFTLPDLGEGLTEGEIARWLVAEGDEIDRKSTRLNSSHSQISYAVFCLKKKKTQHNYQATATL